MPAFIRNLVSLLAICSGIFPAAADESSATTEASYDFSVLTPGLEGKFWVFTYFDLTMLGIFNLADAGRSKKLRALVEHEGYDPCNRIAEALLIALREAGRKGTLEPISRRPPGQLQSLAVDELPLEPRGAVMLDITINWIGLRAAVSGGSLRPGFSLTWRSIGPDGKLLTPGRELRYVHELVRKKPVVIDPAVKPHARAVESPAPTEASKQEFCSVRSLSAAQKEPAAVWKCFDEAYLAGARNLVAQLLHSPAPSSGQ